MLCFKWSIKHIFLGDSTGGNVTQAPAYEKRPTPFCADEKGNCSKNSRVNELLSILH